LGIRTPRKLDIAEDPPWFYGRGTTTLGSPTLPYQIVPYLARNPEKTTFLINPLDSGSPQRISLFGAILDKSPPRIHPVFEFLFLANRAHRRKCHYFGLWESFMKTPGRPQKSVSSCNDVINQHDGRWCHECLLHQHGLIVLKRRWSLLSGGQRGPSDSSNPLEQRLTLPKALLFQSPRYVKRRPQSVPLQQGSSGHGHQSDILAKELSKWQALEISTHQRGD